MRQPMATIEAVKSAVAVKTMSEVDAVRRPQYQPSFRDAPKAQASDVQLHIGESVTTIVSMDSGLALTRAPE
jgi:hypothetical protein